MRTQVKIVGIAAAAVALAIVTQTSNLTRAQVSDGPPVAAEPVLQVPDVNYRRDWALLGTFSNRADDPANGAKEHHSVYTARENIEAYLKTGAFPDGAVIVKDVWKTKTEVLTTGTVSYADQLAGRFVMVKDAAGKLGSGPRFGDGWGWAFYAGDETQKTVSHDYKVDCLPCHEPARKTGLIYIQGYPVLRK